MLTSTGVLKSFTIFQLFTGTFRGCICFQAPVTRAQSHPSAALTDHRSARAAPQPGQARLPPAERAKGAGGACGVWGQRQATARDRGEGRGPSPSPLHTGPSPGAMVGGRLGMHSVGGGGRAAGMGVDARRAGGGGARSARGDGGSCPLPWGPLLAPRGCQVPNCRPWLHCR